MTKPKLSMESSSACVVRPDVSDGGERNCCLHDLPDDAQHAPGQCCCWCGDVFLPRSDVTEHGNYKP